MSQSNMSVEDVSVFEKLVGQLQGVYEELSILSKKTPNDALNRFKIGFVNDLLKQGLAMLGDEYRPFSVFEELHEDDMPQYSDAVFMLGQYLQCFEKLRADNVEMRGGRWVWVIHEPADDEADENGFVYIRTSPPKKLVN